MHWEEKQTKKKLATIKDENTYEMDFHEEWNGSDIRENDFNYEKRWWFVCEMKWALCNSVKKKNLNGGKLVVRKKDFVCHRKRNELICYVTMER